MLTLTPHATPLSSLPPIHVQEVDVLRSQCSSLDDTLLLLKEQVGGPVGGRGR